MIISERLFEIMTRKNVSQKRLSDITGIAPSTITDWKKKKTNPSADKIMTLCEALDVTPYELLSGTEAGGVAAPDRIIIEKNSPVFELFVDYEKCDESARNRLRGYARALAEENQ